MASTTELSTDDASFLGLPVELRELIYQFCSLPPRIEPSRQDSLEADETGRANPRSSGSASRAERTTLLALIHVSHQIRKEAFKVFGATHTIQFQRPLELANDYLAFLQDYQLRSLSALRLQWPELSPGPGMYSRRVLPRLATEVLDIKKDMRNLVRIWRTCPEFLAGITKLELALPQSRLETPPDVVEGVVMFLDEIIELRKNEAPSMDIYFLIEVSNVKGNGLKVIIWTTSSQQLWAKIENFSELWQTDCVDCSGIPSWFRQYREHDAAFQNVADIEQAVEAGRMRRDSFPDTLPYLGDKRWKIFFHPHHEHKSRQVRAVRECTRERKKRLSEISEAQYQRAMKRIKAAHRSSTT